MGHSINWYVKNRAIYMHIYGDVSMIELKEINAEIVALLDAGQSPMHVLVNDADTDKLPANIRELKRILSFMRHPNIGMIVGIGEVNPLVRFLVPMVVKMAGINYARRHTMADALDYIKNYDATIDWQEADDAILLHFPHEITHIES